MEPHYESIVKSELSRVLPDFDVISFKQIVEGTNGDRRIPDLAAIAKNRLTWYVLEIELSHHSLKHHVYPQVETLSNGIYEKNHSYISGRLNTSRPHEIEKLLRNRQPIVMVVVETDTVYKKGWDVLEKELDAKLTFFEVFRNDHGDTIFSISGFIPSIPKLQSIKLKKHKIFNAFTCAPTMEIQDLHGMSFLVDFDNSIYKVSVTSTPSEAILFLTPSPQIYPQKKYLLNVTGIDTSEIILDKTII